MSLGSGVIPAWMLTDNYKKERTMMYDLLHNPADGVDDYELLGSDQDAPGEFIQLDDDIENEADVDEY